MDQRRLRGARSPFLSQSSGLTLIELLVVISVIGVLTAIAIPQYVRYKQRAVDEYMIRDLKNAAIAMESYYADKYAYPSTVPDLEKIGYNQSLGVTLTITLTSPTAYTLAASKPNGSKPTYTYNSTTGVIQ